MKRTGQSGIADEGARHLAKESCHIIAPVLPLVHAALAAADTVDDLAGASAVRTRAPVAQLAGASTFVADVLPSPRCAGLSVVAGIEVGINVGCHVNSLIGWKERLQTRLDSSPALVACTFRFRAAANALY